jgi:fibronectin-binding autotransporter adhesin
MKPSPLNRLIVLSAFAGLAATNSLSAAVLSWDGTDTNANANGGAGTWDTTTANWDTAATSGAAATWPTSGTDNDANFGGTAGTVTIATGGVTANDITFSTTGYTITGAGLTLNGTLPVLNVTGTQTINSAITSAVTGGFSKTGTGTLILGGANTFPASTTLAFNPVGSAGAIRLTNGSALSGITIINGVPASSTTSEARIELTNDITVTGTELRIGGRASFQSTGAGLVNISGNNTWAGAVRIFSTGGGHGIRSDAGTLTISGAVNSNIGARQWDIGGAGNVSITGNITTAVTINKFGNGTLTLSGSGNNYTGDTRPSAGSLVISHINALSGSSLNMVAADTGTVSFDGTTALILGGLKGDRNLSIANTSSASQSLTIGAASNNTYSAVLTGLTTSLAKVGTGTQTFSGNNQWTLNSFQSRAGVFELNGGKMTISQGTGTGYSAGMNGFTVVGGSTFRVNGGELVATTGSYFIPGGHTSGAGNGTFILDSGIVNAGSTEVLNGYGATGTVTINGGTFTAGVFRVAHSTGTLNLNGGRLIIANMTSAGTSTVNFNGGTVEPKGSQTSFLPVGITNARVSSGGAIFDTKAFNITVAKALTENTASIGGGLTKEGSGALTLSGANTYAGDTTISGGTLRLGNANSLGYGGTKTNVSDKTTVSSGFTLDLNGVADINEAITLNGSGIGGNGALINSSVTDASIGNGIASILLSGATTGSGYATAPTVTISGTGTSATATAYLGVTSASFSAGATGNKVYSVAPTVTISGGGGTGATATAVLTAGQVTGFTLTNPGIGYTTAPTFALSGGTVTTGTTDTAFTGNATQFTVAGVNMTNAGSNYTETPTYTFSAGNATPGAATLSSVILAANSSVGGTGNITINAVVSESGGSRALTKVGSGTLTLAGANTYTGVTQVNAGRLSVTGSLANTAVTVGGATATGTPTLAGGGTIGGATVIAAAGGGVVGIHSPGVAGVSDGVGTQTFSSTLKYDTGSIFEWSLSAPTTGAAALANGGTYDRVTASGALTGADGGAAAIFKVVLTGTAAFTDAFWSTSKSWNNIFTGGSGSATNLASIFTSFDPTGGLDSAGIVADVGRFSLNASTNTLNWTPVPEPTSALAGLLLGAGLLRRRRA